MGYDWSSFTKNITVNAPVANIYRAFATIKGIESWFLRSSVYSKVEGVLLPDEMVKENDTYSWLWYGYPDEVNEKGTILKANGRDLFEFTFNSNGTNEMRVSVSIREEEGGRIVHLRQYNIPTDEESKHNFHIGCTTGWTFYLANLKSILEGGIDLRNKNPSIKNVINS
ncbi:MAG TPA: SRPBCC domain-containing protein [Ferruginibacter sp.]|nr:SRPBCC domain-containing protein [Ferruginibacter sp.]